MGWLMHAWQESAARRELHALAERLGASAGGYPPGLLATIDQHAAAVRDILAFSGATLGPMDLVGYARGVQDVATESGWHPTAHSAGAGWAADWVNLRLAAVCLLAGIGAVAVVTGGGEIDPLLFG